MVGKVSKPSEDFFSDVAPHQLWRCSGVSVRGQSHIRSGSPCQDAHAYLQVNDTLILACADGAGSARYSDEGSKLAIESATSYVLMRIHALRNVDGVRFGKRMLTQVVRRAFAMAHRSLVRRAARQGEEVGAFATTLLLVISNPSFTLAAQIGDGAIVCLGGGADGIHILTVPFHGEYVNETAFVTQSDCLENLDIRILEGPVPQLALFTDGLEMAAIDYATGQPCEPFFRKLFSFMLDTNSEWERRAALARLLRSDRLASISDDDKSLVLAMQQ